MRLLICLFAVLLSLTINAREQGYNLKRISPNEGLSQGYVTKTIQDPQGVIWIATEMGLNTYDGYRVKPFLDGNGIFSQEEILTIALDPLGYIWVSTYTSGLVRVDPKSHGVKRVLQQKLNNSATENLAVYTIDSTIADTLWLGVNDQLVQYDSLNDRIITTIDLNIEQGFIRDILIIKNLVYAATSKGLFVVDPATSEAHLIQHRPDTVTSAYSANTKLLLQQSEEKLLVGTVEGLYQISITDHSQPAVMLEPSLNIWDIAAAESNYYIATNQGLYKASSTDFSLQLVLKFSGSEYHISDDNIMDILVDSSGNLWLASASQGVMIWSPSTAHFKNYTATSKSNLSHDNVWGLYQDNDNKLWIGTDNGLNELDLSSSKINQYLKKIKIKNPYQESYIYGVAPNGTDKLWLSTAQGLRLFNKQTGELETIAIASPHRELLQRSDNIINFIGQDSIAIINPDGHYIFDTNTNKVIPLPELDKLADPALSVHFLPQLPGQDDTLILASYGRLLSYHRKQQTIKVIYQDPDYSPQALRYSDSWALDEARNILWIPITGAGLIGLDYTSFEVKHRFDTTKGLSSNTLYNVNIDDNDTLWFSSQSGLYRLSLANFSLTQYEVSDGISANEFNSNAAVKLFDGRFAYGSTRGVTIFDPTTLVSEIQDETTYQVQITDISLMSGAFDFRKDFIKRPLEIAHDDFGLSFEFSTLQFVQQEKTRYSVNLTGAQTLEYRNISSNQISFAKLDPGKYQLSITAQSPISGTISKPTRVDFEVRHSFWLSPSAKLSYLLIVIGIAWYFSNRSQHQRKLLQRAHLKLLESKEQMSLALKGSSSFIWDYHVLSNELFQDRIIHDLGYDKEDQSVDFRNHTKLIHPEDQKMLGSIWLNFVRGNCDIWDVSYRMKASSGEWLWYRDVGRVATRGAKGQPTRLTGTYTNITKTKTTEIKAQLFGEAFSQIKDWVLILDSGKRPVSANKAFNDEFNDDQLSVNPTLRLLEKQIGFNKLKQYITLLNGLAVDQSWHGEETLTTPNRREHPVRISINAIGNASKNSNSSKNDVEYFVLIVSDITKQKIAEKKLKQMANYDHLTKLPNRALMLNKIESSITRSNQQHTDVALFFIDIDRFKQVNDSLGHGIGDKLLQKIAQRLKANIKINDCVARQSGDEFIVLINSYNEIEDLEKIALRINQKLSETMLIEQHQISVSSSIGIAIYPQDASSATDLIRNADIAMFHAKKSGRNGFKFFTEQMDEDARVRHQLERELKFAVNNRKLINYYQPIFDPINNQIAGFELLLRWPNDDTFVPPNVFIPIAEEIGLIAQITEIAIEQAFIDIKQWNSDGSQPYVSINLSAIHILQPGLVQSLIALLIKHTLPASCLRLEITESILMEDKTKALACLTELSDIGIDLFLDDFGTGYSSLTYIKQFPIKAIKIDRSFVKDIGLDSTNESIIKTIISLADNLNIHCIAEGVETQQQLTFLTENGCDKIQGYLISKPVAIEKTHNLLKQQRVA